MKLSPKLSPKRSQKKLTSPNSGKGSKPSKSKSFETIGGVYSTSIILSSSDFMTSAGDNNINNDDNDSDVNGGGPVSPVPFFGDDIDQPLQQPKRMTSYSYLSDIADKLKNGLDIRDRSYRLKKYKRCFIASEAVDFMIKNEWASTRQEAVKLGRNLDNALGGLWHHVCDEHKFADEYFFFKFNSDDDNNNNNNNNNNSKDSSRKEKNKNSGANSKDISLPPLPLLDDDDDSTTELTTTTGRGSSSSTNSGGVDYWMSSGLEDHHLNAPKFVPRKSMKSTVIQVADMSIGEDELLGHVMMRSRISLPNTRSGYKTFHILINEDRTKKNIAPLARNQVLDEFARDHAKNMAKSNQLCHCNPIQLQNVFGRESSRFGENIIKGENTEEIYKSMKTNSVSDMNNILDRRFTHLGVGTAKGDDGLLYVCQLFRGE